MLLVPLYSRSGAAWTAQGCSRRLHDLFALNMLVFAVIECDGVNIAFVFFVWVSIYGVMVIAQLWAFAADTLNLKNGQRLFPGDHGGRKHRRTRGREVRPGRRYGLSDTNRPDAHGNGRARGNPAIATPERRAVPVRLARDRNEHGKDVRHDARRHRARTA